MPDQRSEEMTEAEMARYYEEHKDDMSLWEKKPRSIRSRRGAGPSTMFSLRLTGEELTRIAEAARAKEITVSEFIRKATMAVVDGDVSLQETANLDEVRAKARDLAETVDRIAKVR